MPWGTLKKTRIEMAATALRGIANNFSQLWQFKP
jgi:hypothetical protein